MLTEQFGARLKYWRTSRGLSQERLAEAADVCTHYVSALERGIYSPTLKIIERLLEALNVDIGTFFEEEL